MLRDELPEPWPSTAPIRRAEEGASGAIPQRIIDLLLGYDLFISYSRRDGRDYATALAAALRQRRFACFFDLDDVEPGRNWKSAARRALRTSSALLVVVSPDATVSRSVAFELEQFGRRSRPMIPIDVGDALGSSPCETGLLALIGLETSRIEERPEALTTGRPSDGVLKELDRWKSLRRQGRRRQWILSIASALFLLIASVATYLGVLAVHQRNLALLRLAAEQVRGLLPTEPRRALFLAMKTAADCDRSLGALLPEVRGALFAATRYTQDKNEIPDAREGWRVCIAVDPADGSVLVGDRAGHVDRGQSGNRFTAYADVDGEVDDIAIAPGGAAVAIAARQVVVKTAAGADSCTIPITALHVAFTAADRVLCAGRGLTEWSTSGALLRTLIDGEIHALAVAPGGRTIACGVGQGEIRIKVDEADRFDTLCSDGRLPTQALAFSPSGDLLLAGDNDGRVRCWKIPSRSLVFEKRCWDLGRAGQNPLDEFQGHAQPIRAVAIHGAADLAIATTFDGMIHAWDLRGNEIGDIAEDSIPVAVAFHPDGESFFSAGTRVMEWRATWRSCMKSAVDRIESRGLLSGSNDDPLAREIRRICDEYRSRDGARPR